jgi:hypothetical protein
MCSHGRGGPSSSPNKNIVAQNSPELVLRACSSGVAAVNGKIQHTCRGSDLVQRAKALARYRAATKSQLYRNAFAITRDRMRTQLAGISTREGRPRTVMRRILTGPRRAHPRLRDSDSCRLGLQLILLHVSVLGVLTCPVPGLHVRFKSRRLRIVY